MTQKLKVYFRKLSQVVLYECEFKGQFSDGHWENFIPQNHWRNPCKAKALVARSAKDFGRNFDAKINYEFDDPDLDMLYDRMILYVKAVMAFPKLKKQFETHHSWLSALYDFMDDKKSLEIYGVDKQTAQKKIDEQNYTLEMLERDLTEMTNLFKLESPSKHNMNLWED